MAFNLATNTEAKQLIDFLRKSWASVDNKKWGEKSAEVFREYLVMRYGTRVNNAIGIFPSSADMSVANKCCFLALTRPDADNGPYAGTSMVLFPSNGGQTILTLCLGTKGLGKDAGAVGLPGHVRRLMAIRKYANDKIAPGCMWVKRNPCKMEPLDIRTKEWIRTFPAGDTYQPMIEKYGAWVYAIVDVSKIQDDEQLYKVVTMITDHYMAVRDVKPLTAHIKGDCGRDTLRYEYEEYLFRPLSQKVVLRDLEEKHYLIIEGPPGTGKTLEAEKLKKKLEKDNNQDLSLTVQFHPNMTYEQFIGGIFPEKSDGSTMGFKFAPKPGVLMKAIKMAKDNPTKKVLLHIDEINRADLSHVLGEAIYLFEANADRGVETNVRRINLDHDFGLYCEHDQSGKPYLAMPDNLWIVGTMNSSDRSIAPIDIAIRRRFAFEELYPQMEVVNSIQVRSSAQPELGEEQKLFYADEDEKNLAVEAFSDLVGYFIDYATNESFKYLPGHSYFLPNKEGKVKNKIRTGVLPLLREYLEKDMISSMSSQIEDYILEYEGKCRDAEIV